MLQAAYSNDQIGAFENFHELVEDMLIVLRPGPKVFFQYELRFVNRLKSQLLISHLLLPHQRNAARPGKRSKKSSRLLGDIPAFFGLSDQFLFQFAGVQRPSAALPGSTRFPKFLGIFEWPPRLNRRVCEGPLLAALVGSGAVSDLSRQVAGTGDPRPTLCSAHPDTLAHSQRGVPNDVRYLAPDLTLGAAGADAAFGLNKPINFVDAAYPQQSVTQPFRKYTVGDIEVFSVIDGMRDVPLREGTVRNVSIEQVKTALRRIWDP